VQSRYARGVRSFLPFLVLFVSMTACGTVLGLESDYRVADGDLSSSGGSSGAPGMDAGRDATRPDAGPCFSCAGSMTCVTSCRACNGARLECSKCVGGVSAPSTCGSETAACPATCKCTTESQCDDEQVCANGSCQPCGAPSTDALPCGGGGNCQASRPRCN
jgi:hypothetical protein